MMSEFGAVVFICLVFTGGPYILRRYHLPRPVLMLANLTVTKIGQISGPVVNITAFLGYVLAIKILGDYRRQAWVVIDTTSWLIPIITIAGTQIAAVLTFKFATSLTRGRFPRVIDEHRAVLKDAAKSAKKKAKKAE